MTPGYPDVEAWEERERKADAANIPDVSAEGEKQEGDRRDLTITMYKEMKVEASGDIGENDPLYNSLSRHRANLTKKVMDNAKGQLRAAAAAAAAPAPAQGDAQPQAGQQLLLVELGAAGMVGGEERVELLDEILVRVEALESDAEVRIGSGGAAELLKAVR